MADYSAGNSIPSQHPSWANVMSITPRLPREERLYQDGGIPSAGKQAVRKPNKPKMLGMKYLVRKSTRPCQEVMNICVGTGSSAKACKFLDQHKTFVRCDVDSELLTVAKTDLVLAFVSQVRNRKSDINSSGKVKTAAEVFKAERAPLLANKKAGLREVPLELDITKVLPCSILHYISAAFRKYSLYEMCGHLSMKVQSLMFLSPFYWRDPKSLLAFECGRFQKSSQRSTVCPEKTTTGLFACRNFDKK